MTILFGARGKQPSANELTSYERQTFAEISAKRFHSIALVSLARQLRAFVECRPGTGGPDWLPRQLINGHIVIRPGKFVGAEWGFGTSVVPVWPSFALLDETAFRGAVSFMVGQAILEIRFHFPGLTHAIEYPPAASVIVTPVQDYDERAYWNQRASEAADDLKALVLEVVATVERGAFGRHVVVPTPVGVHGRTDKIHGIRIPESYRALLRWANGVRVNRLSVLGGEDLIGRSFSLQGETFLKIGEDEERLYALKGNAEAVGDEVWAFPHGSRRAEALGVDVSGLCRKAIERRGN